MKSWFITILFSVITIFAFSQGIEQRNALVTQKYNGEWLQHKLATDSAIINSSSNIYFYQDVIAREQFYDVGLQTPQSHVASYRPVFVDLSNGLLYSSVGSDSVIYSDTALYALNSDKLDGYHEDHFVDTIEWNGFLEELEDTIADIRSDINSLYDSLTNIYTEGQVDALLGNKVDTSVFNDSLMALRNVIRDTIIAVGQEQWSIRYADTSRYSQIAGQVGSLGNCVDAYIDTIYPCSPVVVIGSIKAEDSIYIKDNFLYEYLPEVIGTRSGFHVEDSLEVKGKTLIGGDFPATNMLTVYGRTGIGTTDAETNLEIYEVAGVTEFQVSCGIGAAIRKLYMRQTDNTEARITGSNGLILGGKTNSLDLYVDTNGGVNIGYGVWDTTPTGKLAVRYGVGIGTVYPNNMLDVRGDMKLEYGLAVNNIDSSEAGISTTNDTSLATSSQVAKAINSVTTDYYSKTYIDSINNINATKAQYYSTENLSATVDSAVWTWFDNGVGTLFIVDYEKNITLQNDTIFFDAEGKYRITYHFDCKMEASELSQFQMRLNNTGTPITYIAETIEFDMTNIPFEFDGSSVVDIANDNDWVILEVRNISSHNNFTTIGGHIEIERLLY